MILNGWKDFDDTFRAFELLQRRFDAVDEGVFRVPLHTRATRRATRAPWPLVNAYETRDSFVYKAQVPGLGEADVSVVVEDDSLVLRGERKSDVPEQTAVHLRERPPVAFTRKLPLPGRVDSAGVTATMKDGVLTVTLPKSKETLPRQVAVKAL